MIMDESSHGLTLQKNIPTNRPSAIPWIPIMKPTYSAIPWTPIVPSDDLKNEINFDLRKPSINEEDLMLRKPSINVEDLMLDLRKPSINVEDLMLDLRKPSINEEDSMLRKPSINPGYVESGRDIWDTHAASGRDEGEGERLRSHADSVHPIWAHPI